MCWTNNCSATSEDLCDYCRNLYASPADSRLIVCGVCTRVLSVIMYHPNLPHTPLLTTGCSRCTGDDDRQMMLAAMREFLDEQSLARGGEEEEPY